MLLLLLLLCVPRAATASPLNSRFPIRLPGSPVSPVPFACAACCSRRTSCQSGVCRNQHSLIHHPHLSTTRPSPSTGQLRSPSLFALAITLTSEPCHARSCCPPPLVPFRRARRCCASATPAHTRRPRHPPSSIGRDPPPPSPSIPSSSTTNHRRHHRCSRRRNTPAAADSSPPSLPTPHSALRTPASHPPTHRSAAGLVSETRRRVLGLICAAGNHEQQPDGRRAASVRFRRVVLANEPFSQPDRLSRGRVSDRKTLADPMMMPTASRICASQVRPIGPSPLLPLLANLAV